VSQFLNSSCVAHLNAVTHNNNNNNYKHNNNNINNDNINNFNYKNKNKRNNNNKKIILIIIIIIVIIIIIIFARIGLIHQAGQLRKTRGQFYWQFFDRESSTRPNDVNPVRNKPQNPQQRVVECPNIPKYSDLG